MKLYKLDDIMVLGRRYRNAKRSYLLINPLQAKHLPVSPNAALDLMQTVGNHLAENCPDVRCIVGFAETATAISSVAAMCFPDDVLYLQTTREFPQGRPETLEFLEEHSHAAEQQIDIHRLKDVSSGAMLLVDDEISTGKTMRNIIQVLRESNPKFMSFYVGSVLNRMDQANQKAFAEAGINCVPLVWAGEGDYEERAAQFAVSAPESVDAPLCSDYRKIDADVSFWEARHGLSCGLLRRLWQDFSERMAHDLADDLPDGGHILVLGTEECMLPALLLGAQLEDSGRFAAVRSHATTRSPIGVLDASDYPIHRGYQIPSFYASDRATYIYNPAAYDKIIVVTDSRNPKQCDCAISALMRVFSASPENIILIRG